MKTLVSLVHGYPTREVAGTELYTQRVTEGLARRGWRTHVIAATRAPGRPHGSLLEERLPSGGRLVRVVNNLPWRPLSHREKDPLVEGRVRTVLRALEPDLVHVQHLLFLSAHLRLPCPSLGTLHDAWGWCARAGNLLRDGEAPCPGPEEQACLRCYAAWARGTFTEHALGRAAGAASRWVDPDTLHAAWRRLPGRVRGLARRGRGPRDGPLDFQERQRAVREAWLRLDRRLSPSRWLAERAEEQGLGPVGLLRHGVAPGPRRVGGGPLVFVGSLVPHKGAHLAAAVGARLYGPATDPDYAARLPSSLLEGALAPDRVSQVLSEAEALVLGSIWPENAPLVVLEARAAGCPVIAPRIGGLPEIVGEEDGVLYEPGDLEDLRRALIRLRSRPWHPSPPPAFEEHLDGLEAEYDAVLGSSGGKAP